MNLKNISLGLFLLCIVLSTIMLVFSDFNYSCKTAGLVFVFLLLVCPIAVSAVILTVISRAK